MLQSPPFGSAIHLRQLNCLNFRVIQAHSVPVTTAFPSKSAAGERYEQLVRILLTRRVSSEPSVRSDELSRATRRKWGRKSRPHHCACHHETAKGGRTMSAHQNFVIVPALSWAPRGPARRRVPMVRRTGRWCARAWSTRAVGCLALLEGFHLGGRDQDLRPAARLPGGSGGSVPSFAARVSDSSRQTPRSLDLAASMIALRCWMTAGEMPDLLPAGNVIWARVCPMGRGAGGAGLDCCCPATDAAAKATPKQHGEKNASSRISRWDCS